MAVRVDPTQLGERALLDALPVAVLLVEAGRLAYLNASACELLGAELPRLIGRQVWDFVNPADRPVVEKRYFARVSGARAPQRYEFEIVRVNGERRRVELTARLLPDKRVLVQLADLGSGVQEAALVTALSEVAADVQCARSIEQVLQATTHGLLALGMRSFVFRYSGENVVLARHAVDDDVTKAFSALSGVPFKAFVGPRDREFEAKLVADTRRMAFIDDFPGTVNQYLGQRFGGRDEVAALSKLFDAPGYGRAVICGLSIEDSLWGTLCVVSDRLTARDAGAIALFAAQVGSALGTVASLEGLQQTNRQLAAVHAVAEAGAETDFKRLIVQLLRISAEATASDRAVIWLVEGEELVAAGKHGFAGGDEACSVPLKLHASITGEVVRSGKPRTWRVAELGEPLRSTYQKEGCEALIILPLSLQDRALGALTLARTRPVPYCANDVRGAELLAGQLSIQIEKARLIEAERRRVHDLQLLVDVGRVITATLDPDEILVAAATNLARMIDATDAFVWLYDPVANELRGGATSTPEYRAHFGRVRLELNREQTAAGEAMLQRAAVRVFDAEQSPIINSELNRRYKVKSLLALPLLLRDQPIGAVTIGDRFRQRSWTDREVERATVVANQVAVAVANARLFDDLKRSYDTLAQTQEELVKRERLAALGELSAVVAHEVRNPLGVIFNSLGSLRKSLKGSADAEMLLGIVGEEADRLNRIVSDLLDFARPHEANVRLEELNGVLESAREATLALTGGTVPIQISVDAGLPRVAVDARMLRQALLNLFVNAVQASPRGMAVLVRAWLEDAATLRIDITDSGPGIPPAHRHRIFQPFFTTKATGTGLGLAVVKRIVEAHRGEVSLTSSEGTGTTFTVRLPLEEPVAPKETSGAGT